MSNFRQVDRQRPFAVALALSRSYWIVCPKATATVPKVKIFREWLLVQADDDAHRLKMLADGVAVTDGLRRFAADG